MTTDSFPFDAEDFYRAEEREAKRAKRASQIALATFLAPALAAIVLLTLRSVYDIFSFGVAGTTALVLIPFAIAIAWYRINWRERRANDALEQALQTVTTRLNHELARRHDQKFAAADVGRLLHGRPRTAGDLRLRYDREGRAITVDRLG